MKKTVVVNMEYMRPSRSRSHSRSRSRSRTRSPQTAVNRIVTSAIENSSLCDEYDDPLDLLDIDSLLHHERDEADTDTDDDDNDNEDSCSVSSSASSYTCNTKKKNLDFFVRSAAAICLLLYVNLNICFLLLSSTHFSG